MNNERKIYLTQAAYNEYLEKINKLRQEVSAIHEERKREVAVTPTEKYSSIEMENLNRRERLLLEELGRLSKELGRIEIIETPVETINLNDIVALTMMYDEKNSEDLTIKLVGSITDVSSEIPQVTINSPLGSAIYGKQVGEVSSYNVNGNDIQVYIKEKLALDKPLKR